MSVLMFHSIGCEKEPWYRTWLSISRDHFESFCKYISDKNYEAVFLDEYNEAKSNPKPTNKKLIAITFDDGYLDNWVFAFPILKKYKLKGTIFINPEFIDPSTQIRPTLLDVWDGSLQMDELKPLGFVNWTELQHMQESGIIDIQSHSMSHNFYYSSNVIKDIYEGQPQYDWLAWNVQPNRKTYYCTEDQSQFVPHGTPIFEFGRALALRRYFPDEKLIEESIALYQSNKDLKDIKSILTDKIKLYPGRFETDEELNRRYRYELVESKSIIEQKLNKKADYLCWPGGGCNSTSFQIAIKAGYKGMTISQKKIDEIKPEATFQRIKRHAMTSFIATNKGNYYVDSSNFLVTLFKNHQGDFIHRNLYRGRKLGIIIKEQLGML